MSAAHAATFGKWAGAGPRWFVFRADVSDDAKAGPVLGVFGSAWKMTLGWL